MYNVDIYMDVDQSLQRGLNSHPGLPLCVNVCIYRGDIRTLYIYMYMYIYECSSSVSQLAKDVRFSQCHYKPCGSALLL